MNTQLLQIDPDEGGPSQVDDDLATEAYVEAKVAAAVGRLGPNLLDYTETYGADATGSNDSTAALKQWSADASAERVLGIAPKGHWGCDTDTPLWFGPDSGIDGQFAGMKTAKGVLGYDAPMGTTFVFANTANNLVPPILAHTSSAFRNINAYYPEQLTNAAANIDASNPADIQGAPIEYAPFIVGDMLHDATGAITTEAVAPGSIRIYNLGLFGPYRGIFLGRPDETEAWFHLVSNGRDKGVGRFDIQGVFGYTLKSALEFVRHTSSSSLRDFQLSSVFYTTLSQQLNGTANPQPLVRWAEQNGILFPWKGRAVGIGMDGNNFFRSAKRVFDFSGGDFGGMPLAGKYNSTSLSGSVERIGQFIRVAADAYIHGVTVRCGGHGENHNLPSDGSPFIEILTDRDLAGVYDKDDGHFKSLASMGNFASAQFIIAEGKEFSGPIYADTDRNGMAHVVINHQGGRMANWNQADPSGAAFIFRSPVTHYTHQDGNVQYAEGATSYVYNKTADVSLETKNITYWGYDDDPAGHNNLGNIINDPDYLFGPGCLATSSIAPTPPPADTVDDDDDNP